ncbi:MAG: glycosyltransferase family 4 protein [Polyangiales bacterium]
MKVLHLCAVAFSLETLLLPQIDYLRGLGLSVHAACSPDARVADLRARGLTIHEVPIDRKIAPLSNAKSVGDLARLMLREKYDLVHTHAPVASVVGRTAAKLARVERIVYTAHGFYFHENMPKPQYAMYHGVEKAIAHVTDRILVQSREDYQTALRTRLGSSRKITYLGNGIDLDRFDPDAKAQPGLRESLGIPASAGPIIAMTGRITEEKGLGELVEAVSILQPKFPDLHLLVIGGQLSTERDAFEQRLVTFIEDRQLTSHVTLAGFQRDVAPLLALADVFVLPSYREGLPRSVLEAMAMQLPVVATDIRGCREAVADHVTGLLVPIKDSQRLADAIRHVLTDSDLAATFGRAGRERVETQFDEHLVFERLERCYRDLGVVFP